MASASEPATVAEAAELLARASRDGSSVSIERDGGDLLLSTARLSRVLEHAAGDLTVTVEAGIRLAELNAQLARSGQMLALDPPGNPTVGACLAGNLSGPRRHRYGAPRDLVLGVTVVLADGTVASSGGKVVKNVAGYDLGKLFCGSGGRFGLIARASLRLHPLPAGAATLAVPVRDALDADRLWQMLQRSQLVPSAVDLRWRDGAGTLAVLFEGSPPAVAAQVAAAQALLGGREADTQEWEKSSAWQSRARGRLSFPPRGLARTLAVLPWALVRPGPGSAYVAEQVDESGDAAAHMLAERIRHALDPQQVLV